VLSPTSVDLERLCVSSCTPASYNEPSVKLADEVRPLTQGDDDDGEMTAVWIETTSPSSPPPASPASIVWRSREYHDVAAQSTVPDRRRTPEGTAGSRSHWLTRSPALDVRRRPRPADLTDPRGDVVGWRVSGARLPNGTVPGTRDSPRDAVVITADLPIRLDAAAARHAAHSAALRIQLRCRRHRAAGRSAV